MSYIQGLSFLVPFAAYPIPDQTEGKIYNSQDESVIIDVSSHVRMALRILLILVRRRLVITYPPKNRILLVRL